MPDMVQLLAPMLTVLLPVLVGFIVQFIRRRFNHDEIALGMQIARIVVDAAEQVGNAAGYSPREKFLRALYDAKQFSERVGLRLTEQQWTALIEAAVLALQKAQTDLSTPAESPAP